jgi:hypothetical protein
MMHVVVRGPALEYVSNMVNPASALGGRAHLRSAALGHYDVLRTETLISAKACSVAGPNVWNSLPHSICASVVNDSEIIKVLKAQGLPATIHII